MVLNIAHRGGAGLAPENTIACFKRGFLYADMVEFDIQPTKDRYLMVFHDRNGIERTTNGRGKIPDLTYSYLRSLDAGSWFSLKYKNEIIPTLSEVLEVVPKNILLNIELKYYNPDSTWFEKEIVRTIEKCKLVTRSVITARHAENIKRIQNENQEIQCALLQKERERSDYLNLVLDLNLNTVQIRKSALDSTFIQECHDHQIKVFYFYADDQPEMIKATKVGVDGILTNFPDRLKDVLTKKL
jgi:glycerophosphoryl diester phosphodiesterase